MTRSTSVVNRFRLALSRSLFPLRERLICTEKEALILLCCAVAIPAAHGYRYVQALHPVFDEAYYAHTDSLYAVLSQRALDAEAVDTVFVGWNQEASIIERRESDIQMVVAADTLEKPKVSFPVNLNSASSRTLQGLPRIGPALADRIITFRRTVGRFESASDLLKVPGIGPKTLERLLPLVTIKDSTESAATIPDTGE